MQSHRGNLYPIITLMIIALAVFVAYNLLNSGIVERLLAISFASSLTTEDTEPLDVVNAFHAAMNSNDLGAATTLFTEDAVVTDRGRVSKGRDQIRNWLQYSAAFRHEMIHSQASDEKVFWQDAIYNISEKQSVPTILRWEAIIQEGRIKSLTASFLPMPDSK